MFKICRDSTKLGYYDFRLKHFFSTIKKKIYFCSGETKHTHKKKFFECIFEGKLLNIVIY